MKDTTLDLPDLDDLPTLDDSDRWQEFLDSIVAARERRESLRARAEEVEQEIGELEEEIPEIRVAVATGDATESELAEAKRSLEGLQSELEDLKEEEIPAQLDTISLLEDRRSEVKSEEGDKLAEEYAEAQLALQREKRALLHQLADVLNELDELQSLKKSHEVGSYRPEVQSVPTVSPAVGERRSEELQPDQLRREADEVASSIKMIEEDQ